MEAFLDRWAQRIWSLMTPRRVRRCGIVGATTAVIAFVVSWALMPPLPRWTYDFQTRGPLAQQALIGFSPRGHWLAVAGYRGHPQSMVLRIWDMRNGRSSPRHTIVLPWPANWQGAPGEFYNGTTFHWSPDDEELSYFVPGQFTHLNTLHFVDLETGNESAPWTLPVLIWQRPKRTLNEELQPAPVERVEYSPGGDWFLLRRTEGVAVADRRSREVVLALGHVAEAVITPDDRNLALQELDVIHVPHSARGKLQRGDWVEYNLFSGTKFPLSAEKTPLRTSYPLLVSNDFLKSFEGRWTARIDQDRFDRHRMHLYDLPLGPPWGTIFGLAMTAAFSVTFVMELLIGWWWQGFEVSESAAPQEGV